MIYDYIIIGGGIAGLYASFILSQNYKILLLEKNNKLGGRLEEICFHNKFIKMGAGIASLNNKHLIKLLDKIKIKYDIIAGDANVINKDDTYYNKKYHNNLIKEIKKKVIELREKKIKYNHLTYKQFLYKYFPKKDVDNYFLHCEYNDFLDGDVDYHIKYYPITDNSFAKYKIVYLKWLNVILKLQEFIKHNKGQIKTSYEVNKINYEENIYTVNNNYQCYNLVLATTIKPLVYLLKNSNIKVPYEYSKIINSVPFVRIYTYHKNGHNFVAPDIDYYNIIPDKNPLQKIIVITQDKFLMASYSDNENAKFWKQFLNKDGKIKNKNKLKERVLYYLRKINPNTSKIDDIVIHYWEEGVHYFKPMKGNLEKIFDKLNHPLPNLYIIGEQISYRQGWVEGAVESVDRTFKHLSRTISVPTIRPITRINNSFDC
jgi:protoporphyrinogen oxidase